MLFQDKPLSVIYVEECLINPPAFPGTQDLTTYLNEVHLLALGGFESRSEISERVGEVLGSLAVKIVLASCIVGIRTTLGSKREIRKLNAAFNILMKKSADYVSMAWSVDEHQFGGELDRKSVAIGMSKNMKMLAQSTQPDVRLEYEMNVGAHLVSLRHQVMKNFAPSYLKDKLWEGIKGMTGVSLDLDGSPIA